jgi:hypothetical protein
MDMTMLLAALGVYGGLVAGTVAVGLLIGQMLRNEQKAELSDFIVAGKTDPSLWLNRLNDMFTRGFDRLYVNPAPRDQRFFWATVVMVMVAVSALAVSDRFEPLTFDQIGGFLFLALLVAAAFAAWVFAVDSISTDLPIVGQALLGGGLVVVAVIGGVGITSLGASLIDYQGTHWGGPVFVPIAGAIAILVPVLMLLVRENPIITIKPVRAIVSSVFFMALVGAFRPDSVSSFFSELQAHGPLVFGYLGYNIFADGISLAETRWVLEQARRAQPWRMFQLLLVDLAMTAAIFLYLPTVFQQVPTFTDAVVFRGDHPWFGVLFWTTFSTSILFYLFAVFSAVARPVAVLSGRLSAFDVEREPVNVLTLSAIIVISAFYWLAILGYSLLR